ncbi:hypothetical protein EhV18_00014 [Emiliania huxleyi virus 18]|nr:hypothetical protein EhV18_00014 [Emiliania huxleyi virus 18]AHA55115.1 hypothetical protein EhV156_00014 [Emiliania huxleyi virus 156]
MQKCEMREQPLESSETEYSANVGMLYFVCECTQHLSRLMYFASVL